MKYQPTEFELDVLEFYLRSKDIEWNANHEAAQDGMELKGWMYVNERHDGLYWHPTGIGIGILSEHRPE